MPDPIRCQLPDSPRDCLGCDAKPGHYHGKACGYVRCPGCGEQLIQCGNCCAGATRPARWHGTDQRAMVARHLAWWTTCTGIDHLVEDYTRVLFADALGQIRWDTGTQLYEIIRIDERELDLHIQRSNEHAARWRRGRGVQ